jgi:hypothetical protein
MNIDRTTIRHGSHVESAQSKPKIGTPIDHTATGLVPENFDFRHALAYAHLNFHQLSNEDWNSPDFIDT